MAIVPVIVPVSIWSFARRRGQILFARDVVPIEDAPCLVTGDFHRDGFRHAGPVQDPAAQRTTIVLLPCALRA
jgi:hypothetical protein